MFLQPSETIDALGIPAGSIVADFGCGSGAYTVAIAKALAKTGRVYGVDVQKDLLVRLKNSSAQDGVGNLDVIWGDVETPGGSTLRDQSVDYVLIANVLFQAENRAAVMREARRILKAGGKGRLLLIDWSASFKNMGPNKEQVVTEVDAKSLADKAGFIFERSVDAGSFHYGLVFHT